MTYIHEYGNIDHTVLIIRSGTVEVLNLKQRMLMLLVDRSMALKEHTAEYSPPSDLALAITTTLVLG